VSCNSLQYLPAFDNHASKVHSNFLLVNRNELISRMYRLGYMV